MKTIVIYNRVSTEDQDPTNQLKDCITLIGEGEDYEVIQEKQSAFKDKDRPLFETIREGIKKGEVKTLICWDWDRLFRNQKKLVEFFKFCELYKCKIFSYNQRYFDDFYKIPPPFDEIVSNIVLNLMGWIAEEESKKKSERVKIAFKNRKKKWGRRPLENVEDRVIELHKQGKSLREISKEVHYWDSQRNKKFISKSAVQLIIKNFNSKIS